MDANAIAASLDEIASYKRGEINLTTTLVTQPEAREDIDLPVRLDDATLLALAVRAHAMDITLNDLVIHALKLATIRYSLSLRSTSRNAREGRYTGAWRGSHLRTTELRYYCGAPYADVAWALASKRAGGPLPVPLGRQRYTAKADRHD